MCCSQNHGNVMHQPEALTYPEDESLDCQCARSFFCCGAMTGDDKLCDRCRMECKEHNEGANR